MITMRECGCGRCQGPSGRRARPNTDESVKRLEEHQKDLEQEAADVAAEIQRLKER